MLKKIFACRIEHLQRSAKWFLRALGFKQHPLLKVHGDGCDFHTFRTKGASRTQLKKNKCFIQLYTNYEDKQQLNLQQPSYNIPIFSLFFFSRSTSPFGESVHKAVGTAWVLLNVEMDPVELRNVTSKGYEIWYQMYQDSGFVHDGYISLYQLES